MKQRIGLTYEPAYDTLPHASYLTLTTEASSGTTCGGLGMDDVAMLIMAFSGLAVAVSALLVAVGVLFLVVKINKVLKSMADKDDSG